MKIIGHRGAAGLALENTLPSVELARLLGVDGIEIDIRKTKDGKLVLCHDADLSRISQCNDKISDLTLKALQSITLNDGQSTIPTLQEAFRMAGKVPLIIELKEDGCTRELLRVFSSFPDARATIASFKIYELGKLRSLASRVKLVGLERTKPFDIIQLARRLKLDGVGLNFWLLNPLTYFWIKRSNLSLYVYTVNNRFVGKMIRLLYPDAAICTDHPEWFIKHPWLKLKQNSKNWSNWHLREGRDKTLASNSEEDK